MEFSLETVGRIETRQTARGKYAFVPTSSDVLAACKDEEIDLENCPLRNGGENTPLATRVHHGLELLAVQEIAIFHFIR